MHIIKATNLTLSQSISGGTFEIMRGEFVFIDGKNGSGKTALCRAFYADRKIDGGSLEVAGVSIRQARGARLARLRRSLGIVFADFKLVDEWSAAQNVELPLRIAGAKKSVREERVMMFLRTLGLSQKADLLPKQLSNGERQRVAIARALVNSPKVLICDDPFSHLDDKTALEVCTLLVRMQEVCEMTIIIAANKIPEKFRYPYRRFILEQNKIVERPVVLH